MKGKHAQISGGHYCLSYETSEGSTLHVVFMFHRPLFCILTRIEHNQQLKVQHKNRNRKSYKTRQEFRNVISNNVLGMADTLKYVHYLQNYWGNLVSMINIENIRIQQRCRGNFCFNVGGSHSVIH
jgi:hypothetical protein